MTPIEIKIDDGYNTWHKHWHFIKVFTFVKLKSWTKQQNDYITFHQKVYFSLQLSLTNSTPTIINLEFVPPITEVSVLFFNFSLWQTKNHMVLLQSREIHFFIKIYSWNRYARIKVVFVNDISNTPPLSVFYFYINNKMN